jgi:membrane protein CcdC involved in cytochrome C biogenesis
MDLSQAKLISYVAPVAIVILVVFLRMRRMSQMRPLRLERLWIYPAVLTVITLMTMAAAPPTIGDAPWLIAAAVLGGVIGWYRGKMMHILVDPDTHALNQKASPAALVFIIALLLIRFGLRGALTSEASSWHISVNMITDAFLVLAVAMFGMTRVEMFIRAQRLLAEAREAKANGATARASTRDIVE